MKTLEELENIFNSHPRESARFLELCNNNLDILEKFYLRRKLIYYGLYNPTTVEGVRQILDLKLSVIHIRTSIRGKLNLNYYMIPYKNIYELYGCNWEFDTSKQVYFWNKCADIKVKTKIDNIKTVVYSKSLDDKMVSGLDYILDQVDRLKLYLNQVIEYDLQESILPFEQWLRKSYTYGCIINIHSTDKWWIKTK